LVFDVGDFKLVKNLSTHFDLATGLAKPGKYFGKWAIADGRNDTEDYRRRTLVGLDTSTSPDADFFPLGKVGGVKEVAITPAQLPAISFQYRRNATAGNFVTGGGSSGLDPNNPNGPIVNTNTIGNNQPHSNLQSYRVCGFIQKIA
jgi:hypothetical protein